MRVHKSIETMSKIWRHGRGHVAVVWNDKTLIWGGEGEQKARDGTVLCHYGDKGEWVRIRPSGDGPTQQYGRHAEVINDKMYIMQAPLSDSGGPTTIYLYALDLNNWQWTKNVPEGLLPLSDTKEFSSWHHRGKIYYFGGQCGYDDGIVSGD